MASLFKSTFVRGEITSGLFADIVEADMVVDDNGLTFLGDTSFTAVILSMIVVAPETSAIEIKFVEENKRASISVQLLLLLKSTMHKI